jgi:hypothetical protein
MATMRQARTISEGWLAAAQVATQAPLGRALHLMISIEQPGAPEAGLVCMLDAMLQRKQAQGVSTVASTLFPANMYADTGLVWHPDISEHDQERLDLAAQDLYEEYCIALPMLCTANGNAHGTYFGRLVSWPGKDSGGYNQLAVRIRQLRDQRRQERSLFNAADLVLDGPAEQAVEDGSFVDATSRTLQIYHSHDERVRAFPCLVHIDISVVDHKLSLLAVYRHWHLITKALGNLIGLSRLQHFLAQQTGYEVGELMVHGTVTTAQFDEFTHTAVTRLVKDATALMLVSPVAVDEAATAAAASSVGSAASAEYVPGVR